MRRLIPLLAAIALVAGPLATAGHAVGKDRREQTPARAAPLPRWAAARQARAPAQVQGQAYRGDTYRGAAPAYEPRTYAAPDPRMDPRGGYRADPRYDPRAYAAPPSAAAAGAARRGAYLAPSARGEVIQDPSRLRLRAPPRGYQWMQTPRGWAMVSQSTGQVFDVVPY